MSLQTRPSSSGDRTRGVPRVATENRTSGNPMTYRSRAGRQVILIATGGGPDASLVAFALPNE